MKKWHKEPLLHFLMIGAMIFVLFSMVNKDEIDVSGNKIVVTAAEIERDAIKAEMDKLSKRLESLNVS